MSDGLVMSHERLPDLTPWTSRRTAKIQATCEKSRSSLRMLKTLNARHSSRPCSNSGEVSTKSGGRRSTFLSVTAILACCGGRFVMNGGSDGVDNAHVNRW